MAANYINNPISTDGSTLYIDAKIAAGGGGGGGSTTTSSNIGTSATAAVSVGATNQALTLQGNTINVGTSGNVVNIAGSQFTFPSSQTDFGASAAGTVTVGATSQTLTLRGNTINVGAAGQDVFIQGVMNPLTIGGALGAEATNLTGNANNAAFEMTTRALSAFTITSRNMPVFIFNTIGNTGFVGFDVQINNVSIYQVANAYSWIATQTVPATLTPSTTVANTYSTPWIRAVNNSSQTSTQPANRTTDGHYLTGMPAADLGFTSRGFLRTATINVSRYDLITFRVIGSPATPALATGWRGLKAFIYIA
jgi:hypothetical protein